ncbi:MAG: hypothetical protein IIC60_11075 [Proteobacteria bacterium]|nr:hypothetical protein [Pseudomonadota bacterium]
MNAVNASTKLKKSIGFIVIGLLFHYMPAVAQISDSDQESIEIPIEEILVIGDKSAYTIRRELRHLDIDITEQMNALIDDEYYLTKCSFRRHTRTRIREYICQPAFVIMARQYAYMEESALLALGELTLNMYEDSYALLIPVGPAAPSPLDSLTGELSLNVHRASEVSLLTDLQRHREEYEKIVFDLARDNPQLAEKLVRRYYLHLAFQHKKEHWWSNFFGRDVESIAIPTSTVRLIR